MPQILNEAHKNLPDASKGCMMVILGEKKICRSLSSEGGPVKKKKMAVDVFIVGNLT